MPPGYHRRRGGIQTTVGWLGPRRWVPLTSSFCSQSTHGCLCAGALQRACTRAELTWPWLGCRSRTWRRAATPSTGSARRPAETPAPGRACHHHILPRGPCSPPTQPRGAETTPPGSRMAQEGQRFGSPRSSPIGPLSHHQGYHPKLTSTSSGSSSSTGAGMVSRRADSPLWCWTATLPSFCPCRHLRQESNTGTFPGCLQALDILPHQEVLQELRVPGAAVPTSRPTGTDPRLFTTMKTLLKCPGCSELVP